MKTRLLIILMVITGCTEIYEPDIDQANNFLVVEGLFTNENDIHSIKLNYTVPFGDDFKTTPCEEAKVYIEDSEGKRFIFAEKEAGVYSTIDSVKGEVDETYRLYVKTAEGNEYESSPQIMMSSVQSFSISAERGNEQFYQTSQVSNNVYEQNVDGIYLYLNLDNSKANHTYYRFSSIVVLQYIIGYDNGTMPETYDYCWVRREISELMDSKIGQLQFSSNGQSRVQIAFLPEEGVDMPYIGFPKLGYLPARILMNNLYTINENSYNFYSLMEQQLQDEGRFFDPIAAQVQGNMRCVNNPAEIAVGLFEVSAVSTNLYSIMDKVNEDVEVYVLDSLNPIPASDCLYEEIPYFWIN